jgi:hypothetical protein
MYGNKVVPYLIKQHATAAYGSTSDSARFIPCEQNLRHPLDNSIQYKRIKGKADPLLN